VLAPPFKAVGTGAANASHSPSIKLHCYLVRLDFTTFNLGLQRVAALSHGNYGTHFVVSFAPLKGFGVGIAADGCFTDFGYRHWAIAPGNSQASDRSSRAERRLETARCGEYIVVASVKSSEGSALISPILQAESIETNTASSVRLVYSQDYQ
jgi:hypothetical protein